MADNTLIAEPRTERGKGPAGRARRAGKVPAVVYGLGTQTQSITVPARELGRILSGESGANTLITLRLDGAEQLALARQIQRDPVKGALVHVDFIRVRADVAIAAEVPVHLTGEAEGAKAGGVLEQQLFSVTVEARPADIPAAFEHDVSALEIGDQVHVRDLAVPGAVTITTPGDELVATVAAPRVEEEPEEAEVPEGEMAAEAGEAAGAGAEGEGGEGASGGAGEAGGSEE